MDDRVSNQIFLLRGSSWRMFAVNANRVKLIVGKPISSEGKTSDDKDQVAGQVFKGEAEIYISFIIDRTS